MRNGQSITFYNNGGIAAGIVCGEPFTENDVQWVSVYTPADDRHLYVRVGNILDTPSSSAPRRPKK